MVLMINSGMLVLSWFIQATPDEAGWNSLEITTILVSVLMPVSVVVFGWLLNQRLKQIEHRQWANQKLIEKRLALYDELAPDLNKLLCFYTFVGRWKEIKPPEALDTKRKLDQTVHIYQYLLGEEFFKAYTRFIDMLFVQNQGDGISASFRTKIATEWGSRKKDKEYDEEWDARWDTSFVEIDAPEIAEVRKEYAKVMKALTNTIEFIAKK